MAFSIQFTDTHENSAHEQFGEIVLDDFKERISISTEYWDKEKYENQWREAVERIIESDSDINSMLMTSMHNPQKANFLVSWALYKVDRNVYVQNSIIFSETLEKPFDVQNIYDSVPSRKTRTGDTNEPISEWQVSINDLRQWLSAKVSG